MAGPILCSYCSTSFEYVPDGESLLATCPHCGKQNTVAGLGNTQRLQLMRNVPTLAGTRSCPKCRTQIERDAHICIRCGYNLVTGQTLPAVRKFPWRGVGKLLAGLILLLVLVFAWPRWGVRTPAGRSALETPVPAGAPAEPAAPPAVAVVPVPVPAPPAPPAPAPESTSRSDFDQKRIQAIPAFRQRLDETMPLWKPGDQVDLRLKTGRILHATLKYVGRGTNRMAVVATGEGKRVLYYKDLDRDTRLHLDVRYREDYIRYSLNLPPTAGDNSTVNNPPKQGKAP